MSDNPTHGDEDQGFLDAASGIPMSKTTRQALANATNLAWADPSKRYPGAAVARRVLEQARTSISQSMQSHASETVFVPGTPNDTLALAMRSAVAILAGSNPNNSPIRLIISEVEDVGVLRAGGVLASNPAPASEILLMHTPVDSTGRVSAASLLESATGGPCVVVLQAANGELGIRQPVAAVADELPDRSVLIVDGRHQVGRCPEPVPGDLIVADPRMWGGPPGMSVLVARGRSSLPGLPAPTDGPLGIEPPDPPVALIATAALSLESAMRTARSDLPTSRELTNLLRQLVEGAIDDVQVLGSQVSQPGNADLLASEGSLGYIVMFSFLYVAADELVDELARLGWSVASGSACTSDTQRPLHVLEAIGALTHGNLRVSLPPWTTESTIRSFADDLARTVARIREQLGAGRL